MDLAFLAGGEAILLTASCYVNKDLFRQKFIVLLSFTHICFKFVLKIGIT